MLEICKEGHWRRKDVTKCAICDGYTNEELAQAIIKSGYGFGGTVGNKIVLDDYTAGKRHPTERHHIMNGLTPGVEYPSPWFLYYARLRANYKDYWKIGVSQNVDRRMKDLPGGVVVWKKVYTSEREVKKEEQRIKSMFRDYSAASELKGKVEGFTECFTKDVFNGQYANYKS